MTHLIATVLRWTANKLGAFLLVLAVLVAGAWVKSEFDRLRTLKAQMPAIEARLAALHADLGETRQAIAAEQAVFAAWQAAEQKKLQAGIAALDQDMSTLGAAWAEAARSLADVQQRAGDVRSKATRARRAYEDLRKQSRWWLPIIDNDKWLKLQQAKATSLAWEKAAETSEKASRSAEAAFRRSNAAPTLKRLAERRGQLFTKVAASRAATSPTVQRLQQSEDQNVAAIRQAERDLESIEATLAREPQERLMRAVRQNWATAALIVLGLILMPVAIKALLYFGIAPRVARLPPIRIRPSDDGAVAPAIPAALSAGVSVPIDLSPQQELLVHSDFLQSSAVPARKDTVWLLNPRLPLSSIAAGLYGLIRIRSADEHTATRVVVSAQTDPLGEVALIELPAGAAMVVQPRSLAGVIQPVGRPVRISRHWRLGSLHAWLTLQLRYLVFHGPCQLILKGCRGVRTETPDPDSPRSINQSATIGFSANLDYRNTRCETFVAYLRGKEDLFNDVFAGGPGRFVYEEMPAGRRTAGLTGRGLEGLVDGALKVFGI